MNPSPPGLLIHPDYGLWHGYRGALLFAAAIELPPPDCRASRSAIAAPARAGVNIIAA